MAQQDLADKRVLVSGGGSGIGRATALALAACGCKVRIVGRTEGKLQETADAGGGAITWHVADVSDRGDAERALAWAAADGPVDILVNNAGINTRNRSLETLSLDDWDRLIRVNLTGAFHLIRGVLPAMRERRDGLIVNITSVSGVRPYPLGGAAYCASKFGLQALSGVVAAEERQYGIRCTAIAPGEVDTPILDDRPTPVTPERRAVDLQPEDVADAVVFVAKLPPRAHVAELIIKPTAHEFL